MKEVLPRAWYSSARWVRVFYPLSLLYHFVAQRNRAAYKSGRKPVYRADVPVIVIGNITVGGTGKTPLTLAIAQRLQAKGWHPAIITRGYKSKGSQYPLIVTATTPVNACGDEAKLLAMNTTVPVVVDPDRSRGVQFLESNFHPDVILCDDGLQHYALARDIEIAVIDGERGFGNGMLLPAGPLREKRERLTETDFVIVNGAQTDIQLPALKNAVYSMTLNADELINLATGRHEKFSPTGLSGGAAESKVHALAGIGNPKRFFNLLQATGFVIIPHAYPDHHAFTRSDIEFAGDLPVIMTEKDAVKCGDFAGQQHWYLKVSAQLPEHFWLALLAKLAVVSKNSSAGD
ncbi:MAG: tetraacyldisaccharide 4'-kinase [Pseudomonadota bacterium]